MSRIHTWAHMILASYELVVSITWVSVIWVSAHVIRESRMSYYELVTSHTYELVTSHIWASHVTRIRMDETCLAHIRETYMRFVYVRRIYVRRMYTWDVYDTWDVCIYVRRIWDSYTWDVYTWNVYIRETYMIRETYIRETYMRFVYVRRIYVKRIYTWDVYDTWDVYEIRISETYIRETYIYVRRIWYVRRIYSWDVCETYMRVSHVSNRWDVYICKTYMRRTWELVTSHIRASHVTHVRMKESCLARSNHPHMNYVLAHMRQSSPYALCLAMSEKSSLLWIVFRKKKKNHPRMTCVSQWANIVSQIWGGYD